MKKPAWLPQSEDEDWRWMKELLGIPADPPGVDGAVDHGRPDGYDATGGYPVAVDEAEEGARP